MTEATLRRPDGYGTTERAQQAQCDIAARQRDTATLAAAQAQSEVLQAKWKR
jgi:hypothetical protein